MSCCCAGMASHWLHERPELELPALLQVGVLVCILAPTAGSQGATSACDCSLLIATCKHEPVGALSAACAAALRARHQHQRTACGSWHGPGTSR